MALRSEYSLVHSEFNEFLFAAVGEEKNGLPLTVLSALARLGFDPWDEAARLAELPNEAATSALTAAIAKLPEGDWKASDSRSIAIRLLDWLPKRRAASSSGGRSEVPAANSKNGNRLIWVALAAAAFIAVVWQQAG
ncbi:MAG: hypothetical protein ACFCUT_12820 [Kiloniellaceae bacterium]